MVNYVNTVLVSNLSSNNIATSLPERTSMLDNNGAGKFIIMNCDPNVGENNIYNVTEDNALNINTIKVGIITKKNCVLRKQDGSAEYCPIVKWSNEIKAADIKSFSTLSYKADTEDTAYINFRNLDAATLTQYANGGKRIIVRLTFKDMPHRYRKWTESYEYTTADGETVNDIVKGIVNMINREYKRARVQAYLGTASAGSNPGDPDQIEKTASGSENAANAVIIEALPYDDDDSVDSLNWANKVRFNVNLYWTNPSAEGWEANNKHFPQGVEIIKEAGKQYEASAKLVRDRESWAMGYQGILNRGEGTWPIIKPDMETDLNAQYDAITLEFENMYRAADDIQRKTKQTLEVYGITGKLSDLQAILASFVGGEADLAASTASTAAGAASASDLAAVSARIDGILTANSLNDAPANP